MGKTRKKKKGPLPAAQACGLTVTWLAEKDRAGWSQSSAPGTTALNLAWGGEAYYPQTGTEEHTEKRQRETEEERGERKQRREEKKIEIRKHSVGRG